MNYGSHIGITGSLLETRESQFYPGRILSEFLGFTSEFVGIPILPDRIPSEFLGFTEFIGIPREDITLIF